MPQTKKAVKSMKMPEVRAKARSLGLMPGRMKKMDLIHAIQMAEGYTPCFARAGGQCSNLSCCFIEDCLKVKV
ncbi:MAG: Rho termination factor N-terminal domain-containing protein [Phycisphaerales bacterium]|nr:MAG: Rho termination factor N-terminal domain-containing protein [Phycisphaerales bacterium]